MNQRQNLQNEAATDSRRIIQLNDDASLEHVQHHTYIQMCVEDLSPALANNSTTFAGCFNDEWHTKAILGSQLQIPLIKRRQGSLTSRSATSWFPMNSQDLLTGSFNSPFAFKIGSIRSTYIPLTLASMRVLLIVTLDAATAESRNSQHPESLWRFIEFKNSVIVLTKATFSGIGLSNDRSRPRHNHGTITRFPTGIFCYRPDFSLQSKNLDHICRLPHSPPVWSWRIWQLHLGWIEAIVKMRIQAPVSFITLVRQKPSLPL